MDAVVVDGSQATSFTVNAKRGNTVVSTLSRSRGIARWWYSQADCRW